MYVVVDALVGFFSVVCTVVDIKDILVMRVHEVQCQIVKRLI